MVGVVDLGVGIANHDLVWAGKIMGWLRGFCFILERYLETGGTLETRMRGEFSCDGIWEFWRLKMRVGGDGGFFCFVGDGY